MLMSHHHLNQHHHHLGSSSHSPNSGCHPFDIGLSNLCSSNGSNSSNSSAVNMAGTGSTSSSTTSSSSLAGLSSSSNSSSSASIKDTTFTKIFVGGLPYHTTDASLREHFQVYGEIEEAVVITDRQTGKSRGYGFVTMSDRLAAERACKDANPIIDGRKANVNLAYLGAKPRGNLQAAGFPLAAALRAGFPAALLGPGQYGVGPQLLYPSPYVTPPGLMQLHPQSAAGGGVNPAAAAAAAAAAVASGFYDYPTAAYAASQFAANGFDTSFPFGGAAAAAAAAGAANYALGPAFTYASLPPALQNAAAAAAASTGLPLSHYAAAQSQLQEARMQ